MMENKHVLILIVVGFLIALAITDTPECYPVKAPVVYESPSSYDVEKIEQDYSTQGTVGNILTAGISMEPYYSANQRCICRKTDNYLVGDVIVFFSELDQLEIIMHRIHGIENGDYWTKGDNNNVLDPSPITEENIICEIENVPRWKWLIGVVSNA